MQLAPYLLFFSWERACVYIVKFKAVADNIKLCVCVCVLCVLCVCEGGRRGDTCALAAEEADLSAAMDEAQISVLVIGLAATETRLTLPSWALMYSVKRALEAASGQLNK